MQLHDLRQLSNYEHAILIPAAQAIAVGLSTGLTLTFLGTAWGWSDAMEIGGAAACLTVTGAFLYFRGEWSKRMDALAGVQPVEVVQSSNPSPVYQESVKVELRDFDGSGYGSADWLECPVGLVPMIKTAKNWAQSGDRNYFVNSRLSGKSRGVSRGECEAIRDWLVSLDMAYRATRAPNSPVLMRGRGRQFLHAWAAMDLAKMDAPPTLKAINLVDRLLKTR